MKAWYLGEGMKKHAALIMVIVIALSLNALRTEGGNKDIQSDKPSQTSTNRTFGRIKDHYHRYPYSQTEYKMPPSGGDLVKTSYRFFEMNQDAFNIINPREALFFEGKSQDPEYSILAFKQYYKGVPVDFTLIRLFYNQAGELKYIDGPLAYDIEVNTIPLVDSSEAINIALRETIPLGIPFATPFIPARVVKSPELVIYTASRTECFLAWKLRVQPAPGHYYFFDYVINAEDGSIWSVLQLPDLYILRYLDSIEKVRVVPPESLTR